VHMSRTRELPCHLVLQNALARGGLGFAMRYPASNSITQQSIYPVRQASYTETKNPHALIVFTIMLFSLNTALYESYSP
jgi:hypothetical protein